MARGVIPEPFSYSPKPHVRRHGPDGWKDYQRFRQWLRDEFSFRCVYCLERETWRDMRLGMEIDHFQPQVQRPELRCTYSNLLYLCPACNRLKRDAILPDPCTIALGRCLLVQADGTIEPLNQEGQRIIDVLALDSAAAVRRRRQIIGMVLTFAKFNWQSLVQWMGFPEDLPDLANFAPPHNTRPEGLSESWYTLRQRQLLPEVY